jgi:hypothetical protein
MAVANPIRSDQSFIPNYVGDVEHLMSDTAMTVLIHNDDFVLVYTTGVRRWISPGYYLRNAKGYWYNVNASGGALTRCKLRGKYGRLENLLANAMDTPSSVCKSCGEEIHQNSDGMWVHTKSGPRHPAVPKEGEHA